MSLKGRNESLTSSEIGFDERYLNTSCYFELCQSARGELIETTCLVLRSEDPKMNLLKPHIMISEVHLLADDPTPNDSQ